jgi:hypothetical protein
MTESDLPPGTLSVPLMRHQVVACFKFPFIGRWYWFVY